MNVNEAKSVPRQIMWRYTLSAYPCGNAWYYVSEFSIHFELTSPELLRFHPYELKPPRRKIRSSERPFLKPSPMFDTFPLPTCFQNEVNKVWRRLNKISKIAKSQRIRM